MKRGWPLCTYGNAMRNCDSLSLFLLLLSIYETPLPLEIDERFPKLDAFADNAVSPVLNELSYISSRINSPQVRFDFRFELCFFFGSVIMFFRCFREIKVRKYAKYFDLL